MLTMDELARYLKLKPQTIYKWLQMGKIPGAKFGKEWRFRRSDIERWIDSFILGGAPPDGHRAENGIGGGASAEDGRPPAEPDRPVRVEKRAPGRARKPRKKAGPESN
ncbi:MAG TPA: helix-turn-helix domain-containing protein [Planctomycetota bacterium]|nr:helix-turn-helix domain-containing protein [Planctomycetota bacterium]